MRPLASGAITTKNAIVFLAVQLSLGLGILLTLNPYSIILGASSMLFVIIYPLMKRFTYWPQAFLGLTFNWGALLGWSAAQGTLALPAIFLYGAGICWTLIYDTIYAHMDKTDDVKIGVKSTALYFDQKTREWLYLFSSLLLSQLIIAGYFGGILSLPFTIITTITGGHLIYLIKRVNFNSRSDCLSTFNACQYTGVLIFLAICLNNIY